MNVSQCVLHGWVFTDNTHTCPLCEQISGIYKTQGHLIKDPNPKRVLKDEDVSDPRVQVESTGIKKDTGKERVDLISPISLFELSKVLDFGSKKYDTWNWSKGLAYTRVIAAVLRHTYKYLMGETLDPETGLSHMAHVMCNAMFLIHYEKFHAECDDRPVEPFKGKK